MTLGPPCQEASNVEPLVRRARKSTLWSWPIRSARWRSSWVGAVLWCLAPTAVASAHSTKFVFQVDSTADAHDASPGDGVCATSFDTCTLRAALEEADTLPAGSTISIDLPPGTYGLTLGSLEATANEMTISGAGRAATVVTAGGANRDLFVGAGTTLTVKCVTISGGNAGKSGFGGGIESVGTLTVERSAITGNQATAGVGLTNAGGTLTVTHSDLSDNIGRDYGGGGINNGGIRNVPRTVTIAQSTFVDNISDGDGGAILNGQNDHPVTAEAAALAPERDRNAPRQAAAGLVLSVEDSTGIGIVGWDCPSREVDQLCRIVGRRRQAQRPSSLAVRRAIRATSVGSLPAASHPSGDMANSGRAVVAQDARTSGSTAPSSSRNAAIISATTERTS